MAKSNLLVNRKAPRTRLFLESMLYSASVHGNDWVPLAQLTTGGLFAARYLCRRGVLVIAAGKVRVLR